MMLNKFLRGNAALLAVLLLARCSLAPDYERPALDLGTNFREQAPNTDNIANLQWWDLFKDPKLQELIRIALAENKNLDIAIARIEASRAILGITRADLFPRIDISGDGQRTAPAPAAYPPNQRVFNNFGAFGDLSFEIDMWGKLRNATAAQRAELLASEAGYRSVTVSLISQVASLYLGILSTDSRLIVSRETYANRKDATKVIQARFDKGVVPQLDVDQATVEEAEAAITITALTREGRQLENALSVLLGRAPFSIQRGLPLEKQVFNPQLPAGVPANLLERRPDVIDAEEQAKAAVWRIGVARAQQLPSLNLLGFIGLQSEETADFFNRQAFTWNIGGGLVGPLLDWGKSSSNVDLAQAQAHASYKFYEQTVLQAVQEVEDAVISVETYGKEYEQRNTQVASSRNTSRLSRARYNDGVTSYLEVLDNERILFTIELERYTALQNYYVSIVQLYKALGGGWSEEAGVPATAKP